MNARRVAIVVGVGLFALIGLLAFAGGGRLEQESTLPGRRVPALAGQTISGEDYNIDSSRGSWVLVNFFATWCVGCVREHPDLVELEVWGQDNNLEIVSVVFDDSDERVQEFFDERGGTWPVLQDPSSAVKFQIAQIPESFLVSPSGVVVQHTIGGIRAQNVIDSVEAASGE